ncbi:hypothetical protein [Mucilaginibacter agri]|uniref:Uncharacterized protein n=1 Tax=Mucilaginibacter agri TaxID=2695265 RepID=A0A965ZG96_9SPHI|nr:hypothetical protein [Mucilaginibacter agri]NCD69126.1 hypothetical protein [Mucilaginibacter agri]
MDNSGDINIAPTPDDSQWKKKKSQSGINAMALAGDGLHEIFGNDPLIWTRIKR